MSHSINPRGQKRKPEDGQASSGRLDKRIREEGGQSHDPNRDIYWVVQWYARMGTVTPSKLHSPPFARRSPQHKKHKTWDGDGVLIVRGLTHFKLLDQSSTTCEMNGVPVDAEPISIPGSP